MMTNHDFTTDPALCPHCHVHHAAEAACLRPETASQTSTSERQAPQTIGPLTAQAESLFESYLAARLVRARRNVTSAKVSLLREPRSREKREALLRAESEAERLQGQLLEQVRRATLAREQARAAHDDFVGTAATPAAPSAEATNDFRTLQAARADVSVRPSSAANKSAEPLLGDTEQPAERPSKHTK